MEDLEPALADYGDGHNGYSFDIIVEEGNDIVLSFVKGERHGGLTDEQRVLLKERLANRSSE